MPLGPVSEQRLGEVYPELAKRFRSAALVCETLGFDIQCDQGLRTWPEQGVLYGKGRNSDGSYVDPVHHTGIVTYARPGESYHNYGLALDFVVLVSGQPAWDPKHPGYQKMIDTAESLGLVSGSRWGKPRTDVPHLQLTGRFPENAPDSYCRYLFTEGGLAAVWDEVTSSIIYPAN